MAFNAIDLFYVHIGKIRGAFMLIGAIIMAAFTAFVKMAGICFLHAYMRIVATGADKLPFSLQVACTLGKAIYMAGHDEFCVAGGIARQVDVHDTIQIHARFEIKKALALHQHRIAL
jgi:hypothetical protein